MQSLRLANLHQPRLHLLRNEHFPLVPEEKGAWRKSHFTVRQRIRWYCHMRYWKQAVAAASIYGGAFAVWMLVAR